VTPAADEAVNYQLCTQCPSSADVTCISLIIIMSTSLHDLHPASLSSILDTQHR